MENIVVDIDYDILEVSEPGDCLKCAISNGFNEVLGPVLLTDMAETGTCGLAIDALPKDKETDQDVDIYDLLYSDDSPPVTTRMFADRCKELKGIVKLSTDLVYWINIFDSNNHTSKEISVNVEHLGQFRGVKVFKADLDPVWLEGLHKDEYLFIEDDACASVETWEWLADYQGVSKKLDKVLSMMFNPLRNWDDKTNSSNENFDPAKAETELEKLIPRLYELVDDPIYKTKSYVNMDLT